MKHYFLAGVAACALLSACASLPTSSPVVKADTDAIVLDTRVVSHGVSAVLDEVVKGVLSAMKPIEQIIAIADGL